MSDLVALEGRTRGAARHGHLTVVHERDLGVRADVDGERRPALAGQSSGGDHGERVGADEAGDRRREVHAALGVHVDAEVGAAHRDGLGRDRRVRRRAQALGRQAQGQMVHRRVADHGHVVEVARRDALPLVERAEALVDAGARGGGELRAPFVRRLGDAAHDVLAVAHLRVLDRLGVDLLTADQVEEVGDDLGGADVDGGAVRDVGRLRRLDVDQAPPVARERRPPAVLAQDVGDLPQRPEGDLDAVQHGLHALEVTARVADDRRVELRGDPGDRGVRAAVVKPARREDAPPAAGLAHLDADARRRGVRLAGQAPAGVAQLLGHLAPLDLRRRRELAGAEPHEALAARPAAGTDVGHLDRDARERVHERLALGDLERHPDRLDEDLGHAFLLACAAPRVSVLSVHDLERLGVDVGHEGLAVLDLLPARRPHVPERRLGTSNSRATPRRSRSASQSSQ